MDELFENDEFGKGLQNEQWFPLLKEEEVLTTLKKVFGRVTCFNKFGTDFSRWNRQDKMTLIVAPLCNIVNSDSVQTKGMLTKNGFTVKEKTLAVDIVTSEIKLERSTFVYFPTRNMVLSLVNPFHDRKLYDFFRRELVNAGIRIRSVDEIAEIVLEEQWRSKLTQEESNLNHQIKSLLANIENTRETYFDYVQTHKELVESSQIIAKKKKNIKKLINEQISAIRKLPIVTKIDVRDRIVVEFGEVYITGLIKTGTEKVEGVTKAKISREKVRIGKLKFIIGNGNVQIENEEKVDGCEHPHARDGSMCFGEADMQMKKLLAELDLVGLVKMLYSWAFSYNQDSAHLRLQEFYDARNNIHTDEDDDEGDAVTDDE